MLTEEQKDHLRNEELYRQEIRKHLERNGKRSKLMSFLNSVFGIWLLSSVVITSISASWTYWQNYSQSIDSRNQQLKKVKSELSYRLRLLDNSMDRYSIDSNYSYIGMLSPIVDPLVNGGFGGAPLFSEYEGKSFQSLIYLLEFDLNANIQSKELLSSLDEIINIQNGIIFSNDEADKEINDRDKRLTKVKMHSDKIRKLLNIN